MPELPEVETVVRQIRPAVVGRRITGARVAWARTVGSEDSAAFVERVQGRTIARVWRRAKYLVFDLERGGRAAGCLVGHLRMTGRFLVEPRSAPAPEYTKVSLDLSGGRTLHFLDVRKFGRLILAERPEEVFAELGPEPLDESVLDAAAFASNLRARRRQLKPLLLDQAFLAGLGNIYVDESLFQAGLHPLRSSSGVRPEEAELLLRAIRRTLSAAIEREGSSFDTFYRTPEGSPGSYQHLFQVYGRTGQPCPVCGDPIRRIVVGQRGTHFCPQCQPKRRRAKA